MKLSNSWGNRAPIRHLSSPNETSKIGIRLHLFELLAKGSHGKPQTTQSVGKTIGCSPQTDRKTPLLKTIPTQFTEHGEVHLVPT